MVSHWKGMTFTRGRLLTVGVVVGLVLLGAALPYLTMQYQDYRSAVVQSTERLFGAADLVGGFDPTYFPTYEPRERDRLILALNVIAAAPGIQQVASVVAVFTAWGLFFDEINKFLWWPLHFSGYGLLVVPLPLFIGLGMLRSADVTISVGPGWIPSVLAGIVVLAVTFPARKRLDTYGGM
jgi:hypothetical protein